MNRAPRIEGYRMPEISYRFFRSLTGSPGLRMLLDIVFPPLCHHCRRFIPGSGSVLICRECLSTAKAVGSPLCTVCGVPFLTEGGTDHACGSCLAKPPPFDAARAATLHEGAVRELIHRFKYNGRMQVRRSLALLTAERLAGFAAESGAELIIPVPLHARRIRQRGFNQAILLGELLGREWCLPISRHLLQRIRWTEPQVTLSGAERAANVRGAFAVAEPARVKGRRLMLVDDVLTTGSTVAECSRVLKRAGASAVFVATVARVGMD